MMKLSPFIHAGALKKALAVAGVGGVVLQTWQDPHEQPSHSEENTTQTNPRNEVSGAYIF